MGFVQNRQRGSRRVRDEICVRESILLVASVPDLDLKLKCRRIRCAKDQRLFRRYAGALEQRVSATREVVATGHVTELVLIAKVFVPVGAEEKMRRALARPPRFLEITVKRGISTNECSTNGSPAKSNVTRATTTGRDFFDGRASVHVTVLHKVRGRLPNTIGVASGTV